MIDAPGWEWKQGALDDFRRWLETLPVAAVSSAACDDPDGGLMAGCDLQGVFGELSALRQEVRGQNREQSKAVRELSQASGLCARLAEEARQRERDAAAMARERKEDLAGVERRARSVGETECIRSFLEVRDALARGSEAASRVGGRRLRFLPGGRRLTAIAEGYDLAMRRFDRVLAGLGVEPVRTVGDPFDSRTMLASRTVRVGGAADGEVVEEYLAGFTRRGEVLRLAEVGVNRTAKGE